MADGHGNVVHLGERDCSIQRRHQKVIEESPSTVLTQRLRQKIGEQAVDICEEIGYESAGTIEFLIDSQLNHYFIEMNTRIQVEHPVTEQVTGVDLVKEQISVAAGERLSVRQKEVELKGHSIECRVTAEDPEKLTPSCGRLTRAVWPGGFGIRVDTAVTAGDEVTPDYDSLIAKVIVTAEDRIGAIRRMRGALAETQVEGIRTNVPLLKRILADADFVDGNLHTRFLEKFL
jgi:acetyl-CoA carboxylase biotin carboxylase subunit